MILLISWNEPTHNLGVLTQEISLGYFGKEGTIFTLPKGLTVEDVSPRGIAAIGQFENNRYSIIFTSEIDSLVDFSAKEAELAPYGNYYSADFPHFEIKE